MNARDGNGWLEECLSRISKARVTVFGDFCLDAYWVMDACEGPKEASVETGLPVRKVTGQRYSPGGAGNVAANLSALGVAEVRAVGIVGDDVFGRHLCELLGRLGVGTEYLALDPDWQTPVYAKPILDGRELERMDFGSPSPPSEASLDALAIRLDRAAAGSDAVVLNQQMLAGVSTPEMIERVNAIMAGRPNVRYVADSRHRAGLFRGAAVKMNAHEASALAGEPRTLDERISVEDATAFARGIASRTGTPVFITMGERGMIAVEDGAVHEAHGIQIVESTDPVGAGDTAVSAIAAAFGAGSCAFDAARLANIAASVTVRKIGATGVATPDEIRAAGAEPDYAYSPDLAENPRRARYLDGCRIEIVRGLPRDRPPIRHAIFDHDGTLSTLREGWEAIMGPMMVRAILGPRLEDAGDYLRRRVEDAVSGVIEKTTGMQTLAQMQVLTEMVRRFGCVPEGDILDIHGYKRIYNDAIVSMVRDRIDMLRRGELEPADFQIKNARPLLDALRAAGIALYLASGTDEADVRAEAEAMGYAHLFEGRIYGATGDVSADAKRMVLDRIMGEGDLAGPELVTFGDGPVEMRLTRRRGGIAVGVASDEVRRFGLSHAKRSRLIRAGADAVIPDYAQLGDLLRFLDLK